MRVRVNLLKLYGKLRAAGSRECGSNLNERNPVIIALIVPGKRPRTGVVPRRNQVAADRKGGFAEK